MTRLLASALCALMAVSASAQTPAGQGISALLKLAPGTVLRYQLDVRTTNEGKTTGVVENPQGGNRLTVHFGAVLKLEALEPAQGEAQVRATIEQVSVVLGGDTFDPSAAGLEERYRRLEGYSFVVTPGSQGAAAPSEFRGSKLPDPQLDALAKNWARTLAYGIVSPPGAAPGSAWSNEQPIAAAPIKDTVLRTQFTYQRDEPCGGQGERAAVNAPSLAAELCAVILARTTIAQARSHRDPTPDDYRARGLRTAGRWEGSGESLAYVAQRTGWIVSVTETQSEQMDFTITRAGGEAVARHKGRVETQTNLLLQEVRNHK